MLDAGDDRPRCRRTLTHAGKVKISGRPPDRGRSICALMQIKTAAPELSEDQ